MPGGMVAPLDTVKDPFQQVADAFQGAGVDLSINTSQVAAAIVTLTERCVDAGFQVASWRRGQAEALIAP